MYCSQCGKQISEQSVFCNYCGTKVLQPESPKEVASTPTEHENSVDKNRLLFTFKPEFHGNYVFMKLAPLFIFFTLFISFFITIISNVLGINDVINFRKHSASDDLVFDHYTANPLRDESYSIFQIEYFILGGTIAFLLIIVLGYIVMKKHYDKSEYRFYYDRMEYIDGYFNFNKKQLHYKNIIQLNMSQNVFQQKYGIGSIRLTTSGVTYSSSRAYSNGITLYDLPNIESVYNKIKEHVNE